MTAQLVRTYYCNGHQPKHWRHHYGIENPPTSGWSHAVIIPGEKRSTILCPFTLYSYQVHNKAGEVAQAKPVDCTPAKLAGIITATWEQAARLGLQRDFAVAALVLTELGAKVPKVVSAPRLDAAGEQKATGGKPVVDEALRPVKPSSKRGEVAKFFLSPQPQSLHEAMARLGLTRSGVLSHLFCLNRDHGIGYSLTNDCAMLLVPDGFDVFAYAEPERKVAPEKLDEHGRLKAPPKPRTSGKPIMVEALRPIPQPGKRATVAEMFLRWHDIKQAEEALELSRSAVLSHLFTINKENGLGYELSEDGKQARLLVPDGHDVFCAKGPRAKKEPA